MYADQLFAQSNQIHQWNKKWMGQRSSTGRR